MMSRKIYFNFIALITVVVLSVFVGNVMFAPVSLIGLRNMAPVLGLVISPYVGAAALSFTLLGFSNLGGWLIKLSLIFIFMKKNNLNNDIELLQYGCCCLLIGVFLSLWYGSSFYF